MDKQLFPIERLRTRNGRFATEQQVVSERNAQAASYWKAQAELYKRQAEALSASVITLERKLNDIRSKLSAII